MSTPQSTVAPSAPAEPPAPEGQRRPARSRDDSHARNFRPGFLAKLVLLAVVDAFGVYTLLAAWAEQAWGIFGSMAALLVLANWVYFSKRALPLKYILPGLAFLLVYQVFVVVHRVHQLRRRPQLHEDPRGRCPARAERAARRGLGGLSLTVVERGDELGFAIVDDNGDVQVGTAEEPFTEADDAVVTDGRVAEVPGWTVLTRPQILDRQADVTTLRVPYTDDPEDGSIRTQDGRQGFVFETVLEYDEAADTMTNTETGVVYRPNDRGEFEAPDGSTLNVGWRVFVGFENFTTAFTDSRYAEPFLRIVAWTFAFAVLSVVSTFLLGLFLATVFNDVRLRGRKF